MSDNDERACGWLDNRVIGADFKLDARCKEESMLLECERSPSVGLGWLGLRSLRLE